MIFPRILSLGGMDVWTYKTPYTPDEKTRPYIERRGRLALSRALNVGRVVGFVASGATTGYGQMAWSDLVSQLVVLALGLPDKDRLKEDRALKAAHETLKRFKKNGQIGRDATHILGLAANLASLAGKNQEFRERAAKLFSKTRSQEDREKPSDADFDLEQRANPLRSLISDLRLSRLLTLNYDAEIEEEFRRLYRTSGTSRTDILPRDIKQDDDDQRPEPESAFDILCGGQEKFGRALDLPRRVEYSDGTSRSVLSVSMSGDNISDLVNFALHPRQFVGQVVHLHGRFDKPSDMVLTDEDYRQTYMRSDERAQSFEEALSALHSGNDILFVGAGMREADILRPLRQFVSQDKSPDFAQRHVFAMLENKVTLDKKWFLNSCARDAQFLKKKFAKNHIPHAICEAPRGLGASRTDYNSDEQEALRLRNEFGVFALFHGGQALRTVRLAFALLRYACPKPIKCKKKPGRKRSGKKNQYVGDIAAPASAKAISGAASALREELLGKYGELYKDLLTSTECDWLVKGLKALIKLTNKPKKVDCEEAYSKLKKYAESGFATALETELRSRALCDAIKEIETGRERWWEDWRALPKERNAKFRPTYIKCDEDKVFPTHARHRPVYTTSNLKGKAAEPKFESIQKLHKMADAEHSGVIQQVVDHVPASVMSTLRGGHLKNFNANDLSYFEQNGAGKQRQFMLVPPKRLVRCCMPRGVGKGSLLHILQQQDETKSRLFLDGLFPDLRDEKEGQCPNRYHGSFCLHLSFSMEFASVISALKSFVEDALIGVMIEYPGLFLKRARSRLNGAYAGYEDTFLHFLFKELAGPDRKRKGLRKILRDLKNADISKGEAAQKVKTYLAEEFWQNQALVRGRGRMHRLEQLRGRLSAYTDVVDILWDQNLRLLIVMSGLDKLCDDKGSAYNPMFRALFRLLSGCGAKYASESDVTMPLDILFISGTRGAPIRYLSPEIDEKDVEEELVRPGHGAPLDFLMPRQTSRRKGKTKYLKDWPIIPAISLQERYWMLGGEHDQFMTLLLEHEETNNIESSNVRRNLKNSVALSSWCAGAIKARLSGTSHYETSDKKEELSRNYIRVLDGAIARGGIAEVLREVLEVHKIELRAWGKLLVQSWQDNKNAKSDWPKKISSKERAKAGRIEDQNVEAANRLVELTYVILAHLALFPKPVEARVLYGCQEIRDLLIQICEPLAGEPQETAEMNRAHHLRVLSQLLDYLCDHSIVIAVRGKTTKQDGTIRESLNLGGHHLSSDDVHTRFTIQHQLRDFASRLMDLSVPDQGERNFFQVSIYCDQPRDLPSPHEDHYRLVRDIMEPQIKYCRNTIWSMMQLIRKADTKNELLHKPYDQMSKNDRKLAKTGLKERLLDVTSAQREYSEHFESLHAVPQRIRALYGLLRGGFSVGAISRLSGLNEKVPDQPYERFRGWLRGVTNAAIGWDMAVDYFFDDDDAGSGRGAGIEPALKGVIGLDEAKNIEGEPPKGPFARPLYRDEIGWILNERGLMALVTGNIFDAIPLFQRALDEMHHDDIEGYYDPSLHAAVRRVRLNMSIALMERGHLHRASASLRELLLPSSFSDHAGSQVSWLAEGYLGLIQHLTGDHAGARMAYHKVLEQSRDREMMRAVAIFSKHLADLEGRHKNFDVARKHIDDAIDASLQCVQRDIYQLTRISEANLDLEEPRASKSKIGGLIKEAMEFSQSMGVPRIEVEALRLQARLMTDQGDRMLAGRFASRAAAIANRNGLRLQKLGALVTYGEALQNRGQFFQANQILEETKREAERRGYQSLARRINMANERHRN